MTVISSRSTGQSALIDMAGDIANDAIRLSERHRKIKLVSRLFSGGTVGGVVALAIMGVWYYFAEPSVTFRSLDVPRSIVSAAADAASSAASFGGSPFDSIASVIFTGAFPMIMAALALMVGVGLAVVRGSFNALVGAGAFALAMFMVPTMFGAMFPSSGNDGATAAAAAPEKPADWQAWLKDHPKEARTDAGRYVAAQVAYLTKSGALKVALSSWPGTVSASPEIDPTRVIIMERSAFNELRSSMAKAKLTDYQHTRNRLRATSSSAALWLAALLVGTLVTRRLRKTMGARVESAMAYLATRKARA